jgi:hypothetical protein
MWTARMEGLRRGSAARLPLAPGAAGSERSASTGGRSTDVKIVAAAPSARTGGRRAGVKSVAAVRSAPTGGTRACVRSVAAAPSAYTGGSRARARSVATAPSAYTRRGSARVKIHETRQRTCKESGGCGPPGDQPEGGGASRKLRASNSDGSGGRKQAKCEHGKNKSTTVTAAECGGNQPVRVAAQSLQLSVYGRRSNRYAHCISIRTCSAY